MIGDCDAAHFGATPVAAVDMLRHLMETHGLKQGDLPEIGSQGVVSEVIRGHRDLNLRQIRALASAFRFQHRCSWKRLKAKAPDPHPARWFKIAVAAREFGLRLRKLLMYSPASTSRSRSMPVSMPMPCSMKTTSSVATLPVAPLA